MIMENCLFCLRWFWIFFFFNFYNSHLVSVNLEVAPLPPETDNLAQGFATMCPTLVITLLGKC